MSFFFPGRRDPNFSLRIRDHAGGGWWYLIFQCKTKHANSIHLYNFSGSERNTQCTEKVIWKMAGWALLKSQVQSRWGNCVYFIWWSSCAGRLHKHILRKVKPIHGSILSQLYVVPSLANFPSLQPVLLFSGHSSKLTNASGIATEWNGKPFPPSSFPACEFFAQGCLEQPTREWYRISSIYFPTTKSRLS